MHRFAFHTPAGAAGLDLRTAFLVGADGVPVRGEIRVEDDLLVCESRNQEAIGLSLLWPVKGCGLIQLETTRLISRPEPYHLHIELARHRLMRVSVKREEWGLFDYPGMESLNEEIDLARDHFISAMKAVDAPEKAATIADQALALALVASEKMCRFHAGVFLQRRQQTGGFARPFLGTAVSPASLKSTLKVRLNDAFDFVRIPFTWREIQPREQTISYEAADATVKTLAKAGFNLRGGPLLNFGVQSVPDWMYIWENDYEQIVEFTREHVRRTVQRYANQITHWTVASGLHADSVFPFTFEQIVDLTRMAASVARQAAPRAQIILELTQPWGEYYARNQRTIPPVLYAEMVVQSGVPFDAFGLQLIFGLDSEGFHYRDLLQVSSLIDRLANLGKALHVTAISVPSSGRVGGYPGDGWSESTQAEWCAQVAEIALSKPYVESVAMQSLMDGPSAAAQGGSPLREDGSPRPLFERLSRLRAALTTEARR